MIRRIIEINEDKCTGCGICADACHEGAIAIIDNKAKLIRDDYCDGLGDCLPTCPENAITFVYREALKYDEEAVKKHMSERASSHTTSCPGSMTKSITKNSENQNIKIDSCLNQWPIQIKLVPVNAPYFDKCDLLIAADCSAFAYGNFHNDFMKNKITLIGCPKLDQIDYSEKLSAILLQNDIRSITVARMEVPCCGGIEYATKRAIENCGRYIPLNIATISINGELLSITKN